MLEEVWLAEQVPQEWTDATIVPVPKKESLELCKNWRGIALLEVARKPAARLEAERLRIIGKEYLPDLQCGFWQGKGCSDMVFSLRQIMEKIYEHSCKGFAVFADLRKACNSVPRAALWLVLAKLGVPRKLTTVLPCQLLFALVAVCWSPLTWPMI